MGFNSGFKGLSKPLAAFIHEWTASASSVSCLSNPSFLSWQPFVDMHTNQGQARVLSKNAKEPCLNNWSAISFLSIPIVPAFIPVLSCYVLPVLLWTNGSPTLIWYIWNLPGDSLTRKYTVIFKGVGTCKCGTQARQVLLSYNYVTEDSFLLGRYSLLTDEYRPTC